MAVFWANPDSLDLQPGTAATGQARPLKVALLPGHCGLEASMGSLSKQVVLVRGWLRAASSRACICMGIHACVCAKKLDMSIVFCLLKGFFFNYFYSFYFLKHGLLHISTGGYVLGYMLPWNITGDSLLASMCWGWDGCLSTSHQYHFSALPLAHIRALSEDITVLNCSSCIFLFYSGKGRNELCIPKLTRNSNRQNDFDIIILSMTLPT